MLARGVRARVDPMGEHVTLGPTPEDTDDRVDLT